MINFQALKMQKKIYLAVVVSAVVMGVFFYFSKYTSSLLESNEKFLKLVTEIERNNEHLNSKVLQSTFYLYTNYDDIPSQIQKIKVSFENVKEYDFVGLDLNYQEITGEIEACEDILEKKENAINNLLRYNSTIKNIVLNFPRVVDDLRAISDYRDPKQRQLLVELSEIRSALLLARSSVDSDYLAQIVELKSRIENVKLSNPAQSKLLTNSLSLLNLFIDNYPRYVGLVQEISKPEFEKHLDSMKKSFMEISNEQIQFLYILSFLLALLFIGSVYVIVFLLIRLEKENRELKKYQDRLKYSLKHDLLTGLLNRYSFEDKQKEMIEPIFVLLNIDRFKNINDFYGVESGDLILKQVAIDIETVTKKYYENKYFIFRLGADDFGILIEKHANLFSITRFANMLVEHFENTHFNIRNLFEVNISVSIASSNVAPLFECSDMALKQSRKHSTGKYIQYDEFLHNETILIANNLSILSMIKSAMKDDRIIPFFQPIYDVATKSITKYESLVRIIETDGGIVTPNVFLDVAKQSKLYRQITKIMIHKTFAVLNETDYEISINLTYEDINDEDITIMIENEFFVNDSIAKRVIFEITESENVADYDILYNFIHRFKTYGCRFAIDDFGSGYSNFDKILKLEVDFIKIDGSLIKDIDVNENSKLITQMMVGFAKIKNIKTIAEFVSTQELQDIATAIGVDYLQGYHIGKPSKTLLP